MLDTRITLHYKLSHLVILIVQWQLNGTNEEVMNVIVFLTDYKKPDFVTGSLYTVDGGIRNANISPFLE